MKWIEYFMRHHTVYNLFRQSIRLQKLIEAIIRFTPNNGRIVEIGCGSGLTLVLLNELKYQILGVDFDDDVLKYAKTNIGLTKGIQLLRADMNSLPLRDKIFDTVFHQGLLEHFSDEKIIHTLKEQNRIAKTIIIDVPTNREKHGKYSFGDERLLSINYWRRLISSADLKVIYMYGRGMIKLAYLLPAAVYYVFDYLFSYEIGFVCKEKAKFRAPTESLPWST